MTSWRQIFKSNAYLVIVFSCVRDDYSKYWLFSFTVILTLTVFTCTAVCWYLSKPAYSKNLVIKENKFTWDLNWFFHIEMSERFWRSLYAKRIRRTGQKSRCIILKQFVTFTQSKQHSLICFHDLIHFQIINHNWCKILHVNCELSDCENLAGFCKIIIFNSTHPLLRDR